MPFRVFSALFCALSVWSAYLQLNDPDPERWVALYLAGAWISLLGAFGKAAPKQALLLFAVAFAWALAIAPELSAGWQPDDLTATMSSARPEIEYGRELFGLLIVAGYALLAFFMGRKGRV